MRCVCCPGCHGGTWPLSLGAGVSAANMLPVAEELACAYVCERVWVGMRREGAMS